MRWTVLLLGLVACGYPEENFEADYLDSYCAWAAESCAYYEDVDSCRTTYADWRPDRTDCTYDARAARDCVSGMDERTCGGEMPSACNAVYSCTGEE